MLILTLTYMADYQCPEDEKCRWVHFSKAAQLNHHLIPSGDATDPPTKILFHDLVIRSASEQAAGIRKGDAAEAKCGIESRFHVMPAKAVGRAPRACDCSDIKTGFFECDELAIEPDFVGVISYGQHPGMC